MRAARRVDVNLGFAVRADFRGRRGLFLRTCSEIVKAVDRFHHKENHKCDDDEVDHGRQERPEPDHAASGQFEAPFVEIDAAGKKRNDRHQNVIDERRDDRRERRADDHADCKIHHVAAGNKGLEFFQKFFQCFLLQNI